MSALRYWIWLSTLPGVSLRAQRIALARFGSPEEVFLADETGLKELSEITGRERQGFLNKDLRRADDVLEDCRRYGIQILTIQDAGYPERLRNIESPPLVLYYRGKLLHFDQLPAITIVGSRSCSGYGMTAAQRLGYQIGQCGGTVISGGARGIDTQAMKAALSAGAPVAAVLGCGLDIVYPAENRGLYQDVENQGCLISEYIPGTKPLAQNFPRRNRIMSALSVGVLVVEAPKRSGSLITADFALEQGKDVFAVPGNIGVDSSQGTNGLIREGATLVTCGWDIMGEYESRFPGLIRNRTGGKQIPIAAQEAALSDSADLGKPLTKHPENGEEPRKKPVKNPENQKIGIDNGKNRNYIDLQNQLSLSQDERAIIAVLREGQHHVDDIIAKTELPPARVLASLTLLEVKGCVQQQAGKRFELAME